MQREAIDVDSGIIKLQNENRWENHTSSNSILFGE